MGQEFQAEKVGVQRQRSVGSDCAEKGVVVPSQPFPYGPEGPARLGL